MYVAPRLTVGVSSPRAMARSLPASPYAGHGLAFSHTGTNSGTPWADTVYELLTCPLGRRLEEALREWTEPVNNFVYADVHGAYGYRYRGRMPLRPLANGWAPVPGWTGEYEWHGRDPL